MRIARKSLKVALMVLTGMTAGLSSAAVVYENDFSSGSVIGKTERDADSHTQIVGINNHDIPGNADTWTTSTGGVWGVYVSGTSGKIAGETLQIRQENSWSRGAVLTLDSDVFVGGTASGTTVSVTFDWTGGNDSVVNLELFVYESDPGATNSWNMQSGSKYGGIDSGQDNLHSNTVLRGSVTALSETTGYNVTFTNYAGGDITLLFGTKDKDGADTQSAWAVLDNLVVDQSFTVPENQAPVFSQDPFFAAEAKTDVPYSDALTGYISDPENNPLTFSLISAAGWLSVETNGMLSGIPVAAGTNEWTIVADDGALSTTGTLKIAVAKFPVDDAVFSSDFSADQAGTIKGWMALTRSIPDQLPISLYPTAGSWGSYTKTTGSFGTISTAHEALEMKISGSISIGSVMTLDSSLFAGYPGGTVEVVFESSGSALDNGCGITLDLYETAVGTTNEYRVKGTNVFDSISGYNPGSIANILVTNAAVSNVVSFSGYGGGDVTLLFGVEDLNPADTNTAWGIIYNVSVYYTAPPSAYLGWMAGFGVTTNNAPEEDADFDGVNNLLEYAYDGNPTNPAIGGTFPQTGAAYADGGTNWIEHVHVERVGDATLSYTLEQRLGLTSGGWADSIDAVPAGESGVVDDYKTVTNAVPTDGKTAEFLRVKVQQD